MEPRIVCQFSCGAACALHKKELFKVVSYDGSSFTADSAEADQIVREAEDEGYEYRVQEVWLTRDQFDALHALRLRDFGDHLMPFRSLVGSNNITGFTRQGDKNG